MKSVLTNITNFCKNDHKNIPKNIKFTVHKLPKRTKLIRWLFEVCIDFKYSPYTHIRTVTMIDKYTKNRNSSIDEISKMGDKNKHNSCVDNIYQMGDKRKHTGCVDNIYQMGDKNKHNSCVDNKHDSTNNVDLQLVGITVLFICAKIEETHIKNISDYVAVTDYTYSKEDILETEIEILQYFKFNINFDNVFTANNIAYTNNAQSLDVYNAQSLDVYNAQSLNVYNAQSLDVYNAQSLDVYNAQSLNVYNAQSLDVYNELLAFVCCGVLEKETRFVVENAKKIITQILYCGLKNYKEMKMYIEHNERLMKYIQNNSRTLEM
ncbi:G2/mitotic-specific cyclin-B1 [Binucleata daphniae]